jgi:hypothetical protein
VPLSRNLGTLISWNPRGHCRPVTGLLYFTFTFLHTSEEKNRASVTVFVSDMASCQGTKCLTKNFVWTFTPFKMRVLRVASKSRDRTT